MSRPLAAPAALGAAVRRLTLEHTAVATCDVLARHGVASLLLKGSGLARLLGVERWYDDVDLLVDPGSFDLAQRVLREAGYVPVMPGARADDWGHWHSRPWRPPGPLRLTVDLHRTFAGVTHPEVLWQLLSSSARRLPLGGGTVMVPDPAGAALLLALHAAHPGRSDRPLTDLERGLAVLPAPAWRAAAQYARRTGAAVPFALGLRLSPAGGRLASDLGLPGGATVSEWIAAHRGSTTGYSLARLAGLPGNRARWRHVRRRLLPSAEAMRVSHPVARRGTVGLVAAYLIRLAGHVRRTPAGLWEVRAAARAARRTGGP